MTRPLLRTTFGALMSASLILPHSALASQTGTSARAAHGRAVQGSTGPNAAANLPLILARADTAQGASGSVVAACTQTAELPCTIKNGRLIETPEDLQAQFPGRQAKADRQQSNVQLADASARDCVRGVELPCVTPNGDSIKTIKGLRAYLDLPPLEKPDEQQADTQQADTQPDNAGTDNSQQGNAQQTNAQQTNAQQGNAQQGNANLRDCVRESELPCLTANGDEIRTIKGLRTYLGLPPLDQPADQAATPTPDTPAVDPQRAARREQRAAEKAQERADAQAGQDGTGRVTRERVTKDQTRRSNQEFDTSTSSASEDKKEPLLTDFQKVLALGLGAVAVGAILRNGDRVESNSADRVVVSRDGELTVLKDDNALLRRPGSDISTETFDDGSTRSIVDNPDGTQTVTIRAADGRVLRRAKVFADGQQVLLFDDLQAAAPVQMSLLPTYAPQTGSPNAVADGRNSEADLQRALESALYQDTGRRYSLWQVREIRAVRELAPEIELTAISFASGSAAINATQAQQLVSLGQAMADIIAERPQEVFLIEGHTDATGSEALNLALSDRRAETVALALTEYFNVPPENMITQGYGETALKVATEAAEARNRRAVVRRITGLLNGTNG